MSKIRKPGMPGLPTVDNPYTRDGHGFQLVNSVVCFLDILGYRELIAAGTQKAQKRFHSALANSYPRMLAEMGHLPRTADISPQTFALKSFTDNVVVARPIYDDGEPELGTILMATAALQTQLALQGFFVRGAIAIGPAYVDDFGVFGGALLEAYEGEQKLARDPRVVLCASARAKAKQHIGYYASPTSSPQNLHLRQDGDGQAFVSYLEHLAPAPAEGGFGLEELQQHRDIVSGKLKQFAGNPVRWAKYEWVARYHNHFCDRYDEYCDDSYQVPIGALTPGFSDLS